MTTAHANPLALAAQLQERGEPCALCTVVRAAGSVPRHTGARMLVLADGTVAAGTIGGGEMESRAARAAAAAIDYGAPRIETFALVDPKQGDPGVCGGSVEVFIEPLAVPPMLLVIGAGHVGRALVYLAKWAGFTVVVADDRAELCTPENCPGAAKYVTGDLLHVLDASVLTPRTYVALVTRSYVQDVKLLPKLLEAGLPYIGVMGSQRRWLSAQRELQQQGVSQSVLDRVHAPIGFELQAETPEEIAVSIVAEIIAARRGGDGRRMKAV